MYYIVPEADNLWCPGVARTMSFFEGDTLEPTQRHQREGRAEGQNLPLPHIGQALRRARIYQGKTLVFVQTRLGLNHLNEVTLLERRPNVGMHLVLKFMAAIEMDPKRLFDFIDSSH